MSHQHASPGYPEGEPAAGQQKHMKTLKDLVIETKCRKGYADGTTKRGAYWLCGDPIQIRSYGGDGIGQSAPDIRHYLELRHFRSGEVRATVHRAASHENGAYGGAGHEWADASTVLDCTTAEDVIVALKGIKVGENENPSYSDYFAEKLLTELVELGLPEAAPAPDEEPAQ